MDPDTHNPGVSMMFRPSHPGSAVVKCASVPEPTQGENPRVGINPDSGLPILPICPRLCGGSLRQPAGARHQVRGQTQHDQMWRGEDAEEDLGMAWVSIPQGKVEPK